MDEFEDRLLKLAARVKEIQAAGGHLVFADESIFNARSFQMEAWSAPGQNILVEDRTGN